MNLFDIIVLVIVISSTLMGLYKGFLRLSIGFICFGLSLAGAYFIYPLVKTAAGEHIENAIAASIVSSIVGYSISMLFFAFVSMQVKKAVEGISGGLIDRFFGMGAGVLRGLIISAFLFSLIAIFTSDAYVGATTAKDIADKIDNNKYPKWLTTAMSYNIIENSAQAIGGMISDKSLAAIDLPQRAKVLPEIPAEIVDKAAEAAMHHLIEHAVQSPQQDQQHNEAEVGAAPALTQTHDNKLDNELDSQLEELMKQ